MISFWSCYDLHSSVAIAVLPLISNTPSIASRAITKRIAWSYRFHTLDTLPNTISISNELLGMAFFMLSLTYVSFKIVQIDCLDY